MRFHAWAAALLGICCFANSIPNGFVYDDVPIVAENKRIRTLTDFRGIWLSDWWERSPEEERRLGSVPDHYYRPLSLFSYALNYAVHELRPAGYHVVNVALHGACCFLIWHFTWRLIGRRAVALAAALIFAVHPVHCESVANIVGRAEIIAALFMLLGVIALLPATGPPPVRRGLLASAAFFAALLGKETAICYLAVALLCLHWRGAGQSRGWWLRQTIVLVLPLLVYLPLRYVALGGMIHRDREPSALLNALVNANTLEQRVVGALTVLGHYTRLSFWPMRLSCDYGYKVIDHKAGVTGHTVIGVCACLAGLIALVGYRRRAGLWREAALLTAVSLAGYALLSNSVVLIGGAVAERRFYWPSVPIIMLLSLLVCALPRPPMRNVLIAAITMLFCARSVWRNPDWSTAFALFEHDAREWPESVQIQATFAQELYLRARRTDDPGPRADDLKRALFHIDAALAMLPIHPRFIARRGYILRELDDHAAAAAAFATALERSPGDPGIQRALALERLELAAQRTPESVEDALNLAEALATGDRAARAAAIAQAVAEREPSSWRARALLAAAYLRIDPVKAIPFAIEARQLKPDDLSNRLILAEALAKTGRDAEAATEYRQVREALPVDHPLRTVLNDRLKQLGAP